MPNKQNPKTMTDREIWSRIKTYRQMASGLYKTQRYIGNARLQELMREIKEREERRDDDT